MCSHNGLWQGVCLPRMYRAWICGTIVSIQFASRFGNMHSLSPDQCCLGDPKHRQNLFRDSSGIAENPYTPPKGVDEDLNLFYRAGYPDEIKQKQFAKGYLANRRQSSENERRAGRRAARSSGKAQGVTNQVLPAIRAIPTLFCSSAFHCTLCHITHSLTNDDLIAVRKNSPTEGVRNIVPKERGSMRHARMRSRFLSVSCRPMKPSCS
ncbi:hypothetical protein DFJ77DRAFT_235870 [Powellomyces hirtus]|nr:hypothetical protein DFJ77DRAFT_235870 [Powellomyces hirtus]